MIGFLHGLVEQVYEDYCLLNVHDVGYRVWLPQVYLRELNVGLQLNIFIHTVIRDDAMLLYGFMTQAEYDLFQRLILVNGIGPKVAQGIIGAINTDIFYKLVLENNVTELAKLPNIGKKTAERIILELRDKLTYIRENSSLLEDSVLQGDNSIVSEARAALIALGYKQNEIDMALSHQFDYTSTAILLRNTLRTLSKI